MLPLRHTHTHNLSLNYISYIYYTHIIINDCCKIKEKKNITACEKREPKHFVNCIWWWEWQRLRRRSTMTESHTNFKMISSFVSKPKQTVVIAPESVGHWVAHDCKFTIQFFYYFYYYFNLRVLFFIVSKKKDKRRWITVLRSMRTYIMIDLCCAINNEFLVI